MSRLLTKIAIPTPAQQRAEAARLEQKAIDLANERGVHVPMKEDAFFDPSSGKIKQELVPDIESMRMSRNEGIAPTTKNRSVRDAATGRFGAEPYKVPAPSQSVGSPLREKEIIKAHGTVSNSPMKELRHRTLGKAKGFLAGRGG